ncbi:MAG: DUF547 domain-containing protein [Gammaproteobacteria bacterium]
MPSPTKKLKTVHSAVVAAVLLCAAGAAFAAPSAHLWPRWTKHNSHSQATIKNGAWNAFLKKYVVHSDKQDVNLVRYGSVTSADKKSLQAYIKHLESLDIDNYNRNVQRAYWINLYNAETVDIILKHYPVKSIRDIGGGWFSSGPWDEKLLKVEGQKISLNDIEHRILRPIWHDTLTHYGVNCASISCPSLRMQAYTGADIDKQLRASARAYINGPHGVHFKGKRLIVSKIFQWYQSDFGKNEAAVIKYLTQFAKPALAKRLQGKTHIDSYSYNWSLNKAT